MTPRPWHARLPHYVVLTEAVAISELGRAYFSPTVSGWAQVQSEMDVEMSKAMLGQKSAAQAIKDAARALKHDIATAL